MKREKNGFTLIELLAVIVILSIVMGIAAFGISSAFKAAKEKTELVFVSTLEDALDMFISNPKYKPDNDSSFKTLEVNTIINNCSISKKTGIASLYKTNVTIKFDDIIASPYAPLDKSKMVNPANKDVACKTDGIVYIYRDSDNVYYYKIEKSTFDCLINKTGSINNLPSNMSGTGCPSK